MHWDQLELDPKTATERDVKRAYAKKLKTTRPDKDPEGFQKLRQSYEWALSELRWREAGYDDDPDWEESDDAAQNHEDQTTLLSDAPAAEDPLQARPIQFGAQSTEAFEEELDALRQALENEDQGKVAEAVCEFESALYARPDLVESWGQSFAGLLDDFPDNADLRLRSETILFELEHEGCNATKAIIQRAAKQMDGERIGKLSILMRKNISRISTDAGGQAICDLASAAALWSPLHAKPLMDKAYEILPTHWREHAIAAIESDVAVGSLLNCIRADQRQFWAERLQNPYMDWDWKSAESVKALDYVVENARWSWKGVEMILQVVPEEVEARIRRRLQKTPKPRASQAASSGGSGSSGSDMDRRLIFILVIVGAQIALSVSRCSPDSSSDYQSPSPPKLILPEGIQQDDVDQGILKFQELLERRAAAEKDAAESAGDADIDQTDLIDMLGGEAPSLPRQPSPTLPPPPAEDP